MIIRTEYSDIRNDRWNRWEPFKKNDDSKEIWCGGIYILSRRGKVEKYRGWRRTQLFSRPIVENNNRALKEQIDFWQKLIDTIPNPIFYKDLNGVYQGSNKAFEDYLGISKAQFIGKRVYDLAPSDLADKYCKMDEELFRDTGIQTYESSVVYGDGSRHEVIFDKATYTNSSNELSGLVGVITDITEHKKVERELKNSTEKLQNMVEQIIGAMAMISETRDMYTAGHQNRVAQLGVAIARQMRLSDNEVKSVQVAGLLHDIGKIAVPSEILTKPGKLGIHEWGIVREHVATGYNILKKIDFPWPIADIVYQHHERMDGSGYPRGIKGQELLLQSKIIMVADVVEAMSSHRPYRASLGIVKAIIEINFNRGNLYDDDVVSACIRVFQEGFHYTT